MKNEQLAFINLMRFELNPLILLLALGLLFAISSCKETEEIDPCADVLCEYDANCVEGDCFCTEFTENYLVGSWTDTLGNFAQTFDANGTYTLLGIECDYNVNWEENMIFMTCDMFPDFTYTVLLEGFHCDTLRYTFNEDTEVQLAVRE